VQRDWIQLGCATALLLFFATATPDPNFIVCPFRSLTGWLCPLCGMTRALCALMQGRLAEALVLHALSPLVLLALLIFGGKAALRLAGLPMPRRIPRMELRACVLLFFAYGILRVGLH